MATDKATDLFLDLTPEVVLDAIEASGLRCTNVCVALNSFENRVYEIALSDGTRLVTKFYRPMRWSEAQILQEHGFLAELAAAEIPVCNVAAFPDGGTLGQVDNIWFCLFERKGGRAPAEIDDALAERLGMMTARIHNVGASHPAEHRLQLRPERWIEDSLQALLERDLVPGRLVDRYQRAALALARVASDRLEGVATHRLHGDLHAGNLIVRDGVLHVLDFDDMVSGPAVQDLWLLLPGRDAETRRRRGHFIEGYERFRSFDRSTLALVEPLRAMRYVHYAAWLARRWHDPIFPVTWPHFGTETYWQESTEDLEDVLEHLDGQPTPQAEVDLVEGRENRDYFWDMEPS